MSIFRNENTIPNRPSVLGRALGAEVARITDEAERKISAEHRERCLTCAFRKGTFPNGCESTLVDALDCVFRGIPFYCHEKLDKRSNSLHVCAGYEIAITAKMVAAEDKAMYEKYLSAMNNRYDRPVEN